MVVYALPVGYLEANCYIVHAQGSDRCAVIDPGDQPKKILAFLQEKGLTMDAILLTHGHFDHVGGVKALVDQTGCALWLSQSDWSQKPNPMNTYLYPIANCDFTQVHFPEDGDVIHAGGLTFTVMDTPGHSWGSVCYLCGDALFSGDTLFSGSCGRTDLPGGDPKWLMHSLERLKELEKDYTIYPGHGSSTTLAQEKKTNPYLKGSL